MRILDATATTGGPGRFFADHPVVYGLSLAGSTGTAAYAAVRALGATDARRVSWAALALLEAAITAGIMKARNSAVSAGLR